MSCRMPLKKLASFDGFGSVFILDLQTGEEVRINSDVAVSALSIPKIAIFVEAYRALDNPPTDFEQELFMSTATASSNHSANLLLHVIAGEDNTYEGAAVLTEEMHHLGMVNSFMAIPYDATVVPSRPSTYTTPANANPTIDTRPDPSMQTTAEDIGSLLAMLYYRAKGRRRAAGGLSGRDHPGRVPGYRRPDGAERRRQSDSLRRARRRARLPQARLGFNEHGDAGIVYSPGGDYVIYTLLAQPDSDWLSSEYSFPSCARSPAPPTNYFNHDHPFAGRPPHQVEELEAIRAGGN